MKNFHRNVGGGITLKKIIIYIKCVFWELFESTVLLKPILIQKSFVKDSSKFISNKIFKSVVFDVLVSVFCGWSFQGNVHRSF